MSTTRAVCLNCIDGRFQIPVIDWIKKQYKVDYVDMVTEPGMDGFLADVNNSIEDSVRKVSISIEKNNSQVIVVVGHEDCKGNPVSDSVHKQQIQQAVERFKEGFKDVAIIGLWMSSQFVGEVIGS